MIRIDSDTKKLGLFGYPVGHSISPLIHNQAVQKLDLNYVYLPFEVKPKQLASAVRGISSLGVRGVNVTIPHKEKVVPLLDSIDKVAENIGAVNTIVNDSEQDRLIGYNTDAKGFRRMVEEDGSFEIRGSKALVIGAGGAARAVSIALCEAEVEQFYLVNRTVEKAEKLAGHCRELYSDIEISTVSLANEEYEPLLREMELVVDTTPLGMEPDVDRSPVIDTSGFHSGMLVVDLVYNPPETTILKAARRQGAETLGGLPMLLYQAAESFYLWTGYRPDVGEWRDLAAKHFKG